MIFILTTNRHLAFYFTIRKAPRHLLLVCRVCRLFAPVCDNTSRTVCVTLRSMTLTSVLLSKRTNVACVCCLERSAEGRSIWGNTANMHFTLAKFCTMFGRRFRCINVCSMLVRFPHVDSVTKIVWLGLFAVAYKGSLRQVISRSNYYLRLA